MLRRHRAALALVVWTFFVWTTRIGNIWRDEDLETAGKIGRTALALSFTFLAIGVLVGLLRRAKWARQAVYALTAWTVAVWAVQGIRILTDDHEVGFKVVHTVLAVVSIALAVVARTEVERDRAISRPETAGRSR
jgi:peptidoglycan/LPS O-acetylase OafA/YrhL